MLLPGLVLSLHDARSVGHAERDRGGFAEARRPVVDEELDRLHHRERHREDEAQHHPGDWHPL